MSPTSTTPTTWTGKPLPVPGAHPQDQPAGRHHAAPSRATSTSSGTTASCAEASPSGSSHRAERCPLGRSASSSLASRATSGTSSSHANDVVEQPPIRAPEDRARPDQRSGRATDRRPAVAVEIRRRQDSQAVQFDFSPYVKLRAANTSSPRASGSSRSCPPQRSLCDRPVRPTAGDPIRRPDLRSPHHAENIPARSPGPDRDARPVGRQPRLGFRPPGRRASRWVHRAGLSPARSRAPRSAIDAGMASFPRSASSLGTPPSP